MSNLQILSLVVLAGVAAWTYLPIRNFAWPTKLGKQDALGHMRNVMEIRDTYQSPEIQSAATALLKALLDIK